MSDFTPDSLAGMVEVRAEVASVTRAMAAIMADPQSRAAERRPAFMGRRMAVVTAVNDVPGFPLTADVELDQTVIPGCSPQSTYRPMVDDLVWLEFLGPDPHISPPLATDANRKWNDMTLAGAWTAYGGGTGFPSYWRDPLGIVHIEGAMAGGAAGSVFTTLPDGYRPWADRAFPAVYSNGVVFDMALIAVRTTGNIEWLGPAAPVSVFIDGITFRID